MNKYINIIIYSVFSLLVVNYNIGFMFFIPVVIYFGMNKIRNLVLVFISTAPIIMFILKDIVIIYFVLYIIVIITFILFMGRYNKVLYVSLCFALNIFSYIMLYGVNDIFLLMFTSVISSMILIILYYNQEIVISNSARNIEFDYNELILSLISIAGGSSFVVMNINIGLIVAIYFSIYFCSKKNYFLVCIYSITTIYGLYYILDIKYSFIIIIIGSLYFFPKVLSTFVLFALSIFIIYFDILPTYNNLIQGIMVLALFFEIVRSTLISLETQFEFESNIYDSVVNKVGRETVSFASFLDMIDQEISINKNYKDKLYDGIKEIYNDHCSICKVNKECMSKNKGKLYDYYKSLIFNRDVNNSFCIKYNDLKISSVIIRNKFNISIEYRKNDILSLICNGFSTILKQFVIDSNLKKEIEYTSLFSVKQDMIRYGYSITLFNVLNSFSDSLLIEVGLVGEKFVELHNIITKICNNHLKICVSIVYKYEENNKIYFNIVPRINYNVSYGYGSLAPLGNSICGDNYLIKQLDNSRIIAAISDGMGKGLSANIQSSGTLKMIDKITNMNLLPDTAIQILNTLVHIQDYQEIYSTLDMVEINRQEGELLIYKAGGTTTYLIHQNGEFHKILNENLPFGVDELIDVKKMKLSDNDLIILASDGVFENIVNVENLEKYILDIRHLEPQKLVYELLNHLRYTEVINKDDVSIIALKIKMAK